MTDTENGDQIMLWFRLKDTNSDQDGAKQGKECHGWKLDNAVAWNWARHFLHVYALYQSQLSINIYSMTL